MGANDNSHSKQRCLRLHSSTNTQGIKRTRKKQNKFGFPICTDPLAHQHLNENMNLQSKGIYGRESSWSVRGKMAAIARDKHWKSNGGKGRKLAKNMAFHKIISSFPAVSPHLIWHTFLQQCISLPVSSTFNANMILGRGLILLVKYLVCARCTPPFVPCFCSPGGAVGEPCRRDCHAWIRKIERNLSSESFTVTLRECSSDKQTNLLFYFWLQDGWKRWQVRKPTKN